MNKRQEREAARIARPFDELLRQPLVAFPAQRQTLEAPSNRGVYVIYAPKGAVAHVGSTPRAKNGIHQRLSQHMASRSSFVKHYLNQDGSTLRGGFQFRSIVVRDPRERALLEAYAIGRLCPCHIGNGVQ